MVRIREDVGPMQCAGSRSDTQAMIVAETILEMLYF